MDERVSHTDRGLLIRSLTQADTGVFLCHAVEHGFIQPLLRLTLQVIPSQRVGELLLRSSAADRSPAKQKLWYQDFLSLLEHPDLNSVDEFCEHVWKKERKQRGKKPPKAGTGHAQVQRGPQSTSLNLQIYNEGPKVTNISNPNQAKSSGVQKGQGLQSTTNTENQNSRPNPSTSTPLRSQESQSQGKRGSPATRRTPASTAKWKHLQENKRGRNRRTHEQQRPPRSV